MIVGSDAVKDNVYSRAALSLLVDAWQDSMLALGLFGARVKTKVTDYVRVKMNVIYSPTCLTCGGPRSGPLFGNGLKGDELIDLCPECCGLLVKKGDKWVPHR